MQYFFAIKKQGQSPAILSKMNEKQIVENLWINETIMET